MILEERLGVYDHKITQIMQFAEPSTKFKKGEGLDRFSIFRGGLLGQRRVTFFKGNYCSFYIENKLKSKIFNDKQSLYTKMFFSVITNN